MDDKEPFLARWSRRKLAAKADAPAPSATPAAEARSVAAAQPLAPAAEPPAAELSRTGTPEYREFFDPEVDQRLRRTALKKLFSEPQFNVMDGLDTYIDDYSKPDPIPAAMLRQLNQAKDLLLFDEEKKASCAAGNETVAATRENTPVAPAAADTTALPPTSSASAPDEEAGAATGAGAALLGEGKKND